MRQLFIFSTIFLWVLCQSSPGLANISESWELPDWQVLEFEEKAFWATAKSRLELLPAEESPEKWLFIANSSVPNNSEKVSMLLDPAKGEILGRERLSHGKKDQRIKTYHYGPNYVVKERREPRGAETADPKKWPLASKSKVRMPDTERELVITNPYLLILHAAALQKADPDTSREILVHTDENFYRARLTSGTGIPLNVSYKIAGDGTVKERRETVGVVIKVTPVGSLTDKDDFSLLGLSGDIIILFDRESGLPLQIRGLAPRIGSTTINLRSVTMRPPSL